MISETLIVFPSKLILYLRILSTITEKIKNKKIQAIVIPKASGIIGFQTLILLNKSVLNAVVTWLN
jgi:hypothetical protein